MNYPLRIHIFPMVSKSLGAFILLVLVLLLASCGGGGSSTPTSDPSGPPSRSARPEMTVIPPPPPPPGEPDLVIAANRVSDNTLTPGQQFTLSVTVRNRGTVSAAATTLRYKTHSQLPIIPNDPTVGTDSVRSLAPSATVSESITLTAPSTSGIYYYGACVDAVSDESTTNNNCSGSSGVVVRVGSSGRSGSGAFYAYYSTFDPDGSYHWSGAGGRTQAEAERNAANSCNSRADNECTLRVVYGTGFTHQCGALAIGTNQEGRVTIISPGTGTTQSDAEMDAIIACRNAGRRNCRIDSGESGAAASGCVR